MPTSLRLTGELNKEALVQTLDEMLERHEVLRTTFVQNELGEPEQVIHQNSSFDLVHVDLSELDADSSSGSTLLSSKRLNPRRLFNLQTGPLIRGRLIDLGVNEQGQPDHILLATMHHIVSDGWSMGIFTQEISALYQAYSAGEPNPLEPLAIQYADYAHWQRSVSRGRLS